MTILLLLIALIIIVHPFPTEINTAESLPAVPQPTRQDASQPTQSVSDKALRDRAIAAQQNASAESRKCRDVLNKRISANEIDRQASQPLLKKISDAESTVTTVYLLFTAKDYEDVIETSDAVIKQFQILQQEILHIPTPTHPQLEKMAQAIGHFQRPLAMRLSFDDVELLKTYRQELSEIKVDPFFYKQKQTLEQDVDQILEEHKQLLNNPTASLSKADNESPAEYKKRLLDEVSRDADKVHAFQLDGVNPEYRLAYWKEAAEQGYPAGQWLLGRCYATGWGMPENKQESLNWYLKAATQDYIPAQLSLAGIYGHIFSDYRNDEESFKWYNKAAMLGDASAAFAVGKYFVEGKGVRQDDAAALQWLRKSADQGYSPAQVYIGQRYYHGFGGLSKNREQAREWFHKAVSQTPPDGNVELALYFGEFHEPFTTYEDVFQNLRMNGFTAIDDYHEGLCHEFGYGAPKNMKKAVSSYQTAADKDFAPAQYRLAECCLYGRGIAKDQSRAVFWLRQAIKQRHIEAMKLLSDLESGVNNEQSTSTQPEKAPASSQNDEMMQILTSLQTPMTAMNKQGAYSTPTQTITNKPKLPEKGIRKEITTAGMLDFVAQAYIGNKVPAQSIPMLLPYLESPAEHMHKSGLLAINKILETEAPDPNDIALAWPLVINIYKNDSESIKPLAQKCLQVIDGKYELTENQKREYNTLLN